MKKNMFYLRYILFPKTICLSIIKEMLKHSHFWEPLIHRPFGKKRKALRPHPGRTKRSSDTWDYFPPCVYTKKPFFSLSLSLRSMEFLTLCVDPASIRILVFIRRVTMLWLQFFRTNFWSTVAFLPRGLGVIFFGWVWAAPVQFSQDLRATAPQIDALWKTREESIQIKCDKEKWYFKNV